MIICVHCGAVIEKVGKEWVQKEGSGVLPQFCKDIRLKRWKMHEPVEANVKGIRHASHNNDAHSISS